jgi:hypothetical protein
MYARVAFSAERDQILFLVVTRLAPKFLVMHLQMLHAAAGLASPAIPPFLIPERFPRVF